MDSLALRYRFREERELALLYARKMGDELALKLIDRGVVTNGSEARHLASFFWRMVDEAIKRPLKLPFDGSEEFWTEKLMNSFGGYLKRAGYGDEWDQEVDKA